MAISGRPILDDFDDPVQALTDGIGQGSVDEGQDVDEVRIKGTTAAHDGRFWRIASSLRPHITSA